MRSDDLRSCADNIRIREMFEECTALISAVETSNLDRLPIAF